MFGFKRDIPEATPKSNRINAVTQFIKSKNWKYQFDEEDSQIRLGFNIDGKIRNVPIIIDFRSDDCYIVVSHLSMNADKASYHSILRLINHINYTAKFGNYEMDEEDGEIRYRMTVDCEGITPSNAMIERSILIPVTMMKRFGEYFIQVIMGYKTYEDIQKELDV